MPEVTFDPQAGEAFVSVNGQPLEASPEVDPPSSYEPHEESAPSPIYEEEEVGATYEEPEQDDLDGFNDVQRAAIEGWTERGIDALGALEWAASDDSPLNDETFGRISQLVQDEDPEVVSAAMGVLTLVQQRPDAFDLADDYVGTEWSQEQEHQLVDCVGGEYASEIINLNYRINSGEITRGEAFRYVASNPELQNAYLAAANAGVLVIHI